MPEKKEVVAIVRKYTTATGEECEISFTKNVKLGERLYFNTKETEVYRIKK